MNYKEVQEYKNHLYSQDQFKVRVDVEGFKKFEQEFIASYDALKASLVEIASQLGVEDFNPNSTRSRAEYLAALGFNAEEGTNKEALERIVSSSLSREVSKVSLLVKFASAENLRRKIQGAAKKNNGFESLIVDGVIDGSDWTLSEGRSYQKNLYSLPMELREFILPFYKSEFVYFDLSAAELTLAGTLAQDDVLLNDIYSGSFWNYWYDFLELTPADKPAIKVAIYSIMYSLSDVSIVAPVPAQKFFSAFVRRYRRLVSWLRSRYQPARKAMYSGATTWTNRGWADQEFTYDLTSRNALFKVLNYPIQMGLANIVQVIASRLSDYYYLSCINFDSVLCSGCTKDAVVSMLDSVMREMGIKFVYKISTGRNYREAQEGT